MGMMGYGLWEWVGKVREGGWKSVGIVLFDDYFWGGVSSSSSVDS
jgi:hypothetical protein